MNLSRIVAYSVSASPLNENISLVNRGGLETIHPAPMQRPYADASKAKYSKCEGIGQDIASLGLVPFTLCLGGGIWPTWHSTGRLLFPTGKLVYPFHESQSMTIKTFVFAHERPRSIITMLRMKVFQRSTIISVKMDGPEPQYCVGLTTNHLSVHVVPYWLMASLSEYLFFLANDLPQCLHATILL